MKKIVYKNLETKEYIELEDTLEYAINQFINDKDDRQEVIKEFGMQDMEFKYQLMHLLVMESEFLEWFYSGNYLLKEI